MVSWEEQLGLVFLTMLNEIIDARLCQSRSVSLLLRWPTGLASKGQLVAVGSALRPFAN